MYVVIAMDALIDFNEPTERYLHVLEYHDLLVQLIEGI